MLLSSSKIKISYAYLSLRLTTNAGCTLKTLPLNIRHRTIDNKWEKFISELEHILFHGGNSFTCIWHPLQLHETSRTKSTAMHG